MYFPYFGYKYAIAKRSHATMHTHLKQSATIIISSDKFTSMPSQSVATATLIVHKMRSCMSMYKCSVLLGIMNCLEHISNSIATICTEVLHSCLDK